jgi:hypothetical protein
VGGEQLADDADLFDVVDSHEDDRQISGNAVRPKPAGPPPPRRMVSDDGRSDESA